MMHLISFLIHSVMNHTVGSWAHPQDRRIEALKSFDEWKKLGQILERGCFDAVFFADVPAVYDQYRNSTDDGVRYGVCWPNHDPMVAVTTMAAATKKLGFVVTKSVSSAHPYEVVRALSTLDYMSGGRVGWNVVTGHLRSEHRAVGLEQMEHDERYDRADEYMKVCHSLWDGIDPSAIIADKESLIFADPAKIKRVAHNGKYIRCNAVPPVLPSKQHRPVLFQAGSTSRGKTFALKNAEVIFAIQRGGQ